MSVIRKLAFVSLLAAALACGSKQQTPARSLPKYDAEQATLFGDVFRPDLFGLGTDRSVGIDNLLRDRASRADTVVLARVVTINRETRGKVRGYSVVLAPAESALIGSTPSGPLTVTITETNPVFGWLEGAGNHWGGTRMLLFLREFQDGTHFFGCADTQEVRGVVQTTANARSPRP